VLLQAGQALCGLLWIAWLAYTEWRDDMAKKGFRLQAKRYQLTFEDGDLDGLECTMSGVSLEKFLEVAAAADALSTPEGRTPENIEAQFRMLGELLLSWNLTDDDDQPVEPSYEALKQFDFSYVQLILQAYLAAFSTVPKASDEPSSSGGTSPERSLGLARQSKSHAS
jgi:hypothetical protein